MRNKTYLSTQFLFLFFFTDAYTVYVKCKFSILRFMNYQRFDNIITIVIYTLLGILDIVDYV